MQLSAKRLGSQTVSLWSSPSIEAGACVVGKKEGEGPLSQTFDLISEDSYFGEKTWEKAESVMIRQCFALAADKAKTPPSDIQYLFAGDLLNQCVATTYALRDSGIPYFGLYGACSTLTEGLSLAAMTIDGGFADTVASLTASHFCSAERQFRFPLEYGSVNTPTAQWTVTGAGAFILKAQGAGPYITHVTSGKIVDVGITDVNNMGAAMAPAAFETLRTHFEDTGRDPGFYDLILTGDLGFLGRDIVVDLFQRQGVELGDRYLDCGLLIFDRLVQKEVGAGGSGCGCSAAVMAGHILGGFQSGLFKNVLMASTGALMSPVTTQQKESIPAICHAVSVSASPDGR